jgi:RNA polymerase sigma factor (sigma-70 family)
MRECALMTFKDDEGAGRGSSARVSSPQTPSCPTDDGLFSPSGLSGEELSDLFRTQRSRLCRAVRHRVGDVEEAADLVQDAFVRLAQARPAGVLRAPQAYLQRIVGNLLRDRAKRARHRIVVVDEALSAGREPAADPEQEWNLEVNDLRASYTAALAELTPRTREVFLLHRVEELRYRDIAERLGITVPTVEYHMARALGHLDKALIQ